MLTVKPFKALHPTGDFVEKVHICHGVAGDEKKSLEILKSNPYSMLHVTHADLALSQGIESDIDKNNSLSHINTLSESSACNTEDAVRNRSRNVMHKFIEQGVFVCDKTENMYISRLTREGHTQTGLIVCTDAMDYLDGKIKKHELTRAERVDVQEEQIERVGGNIEPIFLVSDSNEWDGKIIDEYADSHEVDCDFIDENGVRHRMWTISEPEIIEDIETRFMSINSLYICDGHHRIAASAKYWLDNRKDETDETGRYFMSIIFPSDQMNIIDYNRAVTDSGDMTIEEFLDAVRCAGFSVESAGTAPIKPSKLGEFAMCLADSWYRLEYIGHRSESNPVDGLDVSILQDKIIAGIFGITDPSHDHRLTFVSGTKGMPALLNAAGDHGVAFALYPVSMTDIMRVADAGMTMPPKSTRFEPKPACGVLIYPIS